MFWCVWLLIISTDCELRLPSELHERGSAWFAQPAPNRSEELRLLTQQLRDPLSDLGGLLFFAFFVMNVGFPEEHPDRNCIDIEYIHSVIRTLLNVLRKSRPKLEAGYSKRFMRKRA